MNFQSFNQSYKQGLDNLLKKYHQTISENKNVQSMIEEKQIIKDVAHYEDIQARSIALEESVRKRNESINRIVLIFVITFFSMFLVILIYIYFLPQLPIVTILVIIISTGIIIAGRQYYEMTIRSNYDYDDYDYNPPIIIERPEPGATPATNIYSESETSKLVSLKALNCFASSCCASGTSWDAKTGKCIPLM